MKRTFRAFSSRAKLYLEVLAIKGQRAADQSVEDHAQTPHVHLRTVVLLPLNTHTHSECQNKTEVASFWLHLKKHRSEPERVLGQRTVENHKMCPAFLRL